MLHLLSTAEAGLHNGQSRLFAIEPAPLSASEKHCKYTLFFQVTHLNNAFLTTRAFFPHRPHKHIPSRHQNITRATKLTSAFEAERPFNDKLKKNITYAQPAQQQVTRPHTLLTYCLLTDVVYYQPETHYVATHYNHTRISSYICNQSAAFLRPFRCNSLSIKTRGSILQVYTDAGPRSASWQTEQRLASSNI